jgi:hypothetical protein
MDLKSSKAPNTQKHRMMKLSRRDLEWMKVLNSAHYLKMRQSLAEFESKSTEVASCDGLSRKGAGEALAVFRTIWPNGGVEPHRRR